jgi:nucleotidyltransferase/DNA polymerase involved in DNA repair
MAAKKNGRSRGSQPSKPSRRVTEQVEHVVAADRGLTIREEFAMAAMSGLCAHYGLASDGFDHIADLAAMQADALLARLAKDGAA